MGLIIVICALLLASPASAEVLRGPIEAVVTRVVDGDTFEARAHIWLRQEVTVLVRVAGIDTPELHGPCPEAARAARDHLARLLESGPVSLVDVRHDKYGRRVLALVRLADGRDLGQAMLAAKKAKPAARGRVETCR
jgi:endonuclease YncB( thermonuclease family)